MYRRDIIRLLEEWQQEAFEESPTRRVRKEAVRALNKEISEQQMRFGGEGKVETPKGCEKQESFYLKTGILMISPDHDQLISAELPELRQAFEDFDESNPQRPSDELLDSVDASWSTNVTMVDLEWQRNREDWHFDIDVAHDPLELGSRLESIGLVLPEGNRRGLVDYTTFWSCHLPTVWRLMKRRIKIEACIGDVSSVLEQIRYRVVGH